MKLFMSWMPDGAPKFCSQDVMRLTVIKYVEYGSCEPFSRAVRRYGDHASGRWGMMLEGFRDWFDRYAPRNQKEIVIGYDDQWCEGNYIKDYVKDVILGFYEEHAAKEVPMNTWVKFVEMRSIAHFFGMDYEDPYSVALEKLGWNADGFDPEDYYARRILALDQYLTKSCGGGHCLRTLNGGI